ncbi:MAG: hypothetical protein ABR608_15305 [Pseudonocardiaceae bacterium]
MISSFCSGALGQAVVFIVLGDFIAIEQVDCSVVSPCGYATRLQYLVPSGWSSQMICCSGVTVFMWLREQREQCGRLGDIVGEDGSP